MSAPTRYLKGKTPYGDINAKVEYSNSNNKITLTLSYKDLNGKWKFHCFDCTTDPGIYWAENLFCCYYMFIVTSLSHHYTMMSCH